MRGAMPSGHKVCQPHAQNRRRRASGHVPGGVNLGRGYGGASLGGQTAGTQWEGDARGYRIQGQHIAAPVHLHCIRGDRYIPCTWRCPLPRSESGCKSRGQPRIQLLHTGPTSGTRPRRRPSPHLMTLFQVKLGLTQSRRIALHTKTPPAIHPASLSQQVGHALGSLLTRRAPAALPAWFVPANRHRHRCHCQQLPDLPGQVH